MHPSFWFVSRNPTQINKLVFYFLFIFLLLILAVFFFVNIYLVKKQPFKKRFYLRLGWISLGFIIASVVLTFFRFTGTAFLSARAVWLPFFLILFYVGFLNFLEYSRKLPEKESRFQAEQIKKRYLKPFKKKK